MSWPLSGVILSGVHSISLDAVLALVLVLGGLASAVLVYLGAGAFARRQSRSYLLLVFALGMLAAKAAVGGLTMVNVVPTISHHVLEHALDLATAVFLIAAIYHARTASQGVRPADE